MSGALRTVLAVLLAAALLTVGLAAADRARESRTATRLDETATGLTSVVDRLAARNDPTAMGAARRTVTLHVPPGGALRIERGLVRWRVDGGPWHDRQPSVDLEPARSPVDLAPGHHRLRLSLHREDGTPVVVTRGPRS